MWPETRASSVYATGQPREAQNEPTPAGMGEGSKNNEWIQGSSPTAVKAQKLPLCPDTTHWRKEKQQEMQKHQDQLSAYSKKII